ncbi:MAG: hypothetical protein FWG77_08360 [Treponema sp.]|nr:hypothetical protein [Treponema sp.]
MKSFLALLLFGLTLSISAQSNPPPSFFISPIEGQGTGPGDNNFIVVNVGNEIRARDYIITSSVFDAEYVIAGRIENAGDYYGDPELWDSFILVLELRNPGTGMNFLEQQLVYSTIEDLGYFFPLLMHNMMSMFGESLESGAFEPIDDTWKNKHIYLSAIAYWTPRIYMGLDSSFHYRNFGGALLAEWHFTNFLALKAGAGIAPEWVRVTNQEGYQDLILEVPVALQFVFKPSTHFMLEPYGGIMLNFPLMHRITDPSLISAMAGFQYGVKMGPGVFVVNPRLSIDLRLSRLHESESTYRRYLIHIGLGYKLGFITR